MGEDRGPMRAHVWRVNWEPLTGYLSCHVGGRRDGIGMVLGGGCYGKTAGLIAFGILCKMITQQAGRPARMVRRVADCGVAMVFSAKDDFRD